MNDKLSQIVEKLKDAKNVLVTVSKDPSIDQVAAAIGLTVGLNNTEKHATAVYSGQTPTTVDFLKPEETFEKNTDSLRDFIIALDKSKADKLRYKVEDDVVRIYVTPYRTSLSEKDLEFSQGDFNVDMVIALGVKSQEDLDEAIRAHGRIFHSASVISIDTEEGSDIGAENWVDTSASSLSEMVADLLAKLDSKSLESQVSTALLTGIVSATDRFSNAKTSPRTMSTSAALMATGANQQLISEELRQSVTQQASDGARPASDDSVLDLGHEEGANTTEVSASPEEPEKVTENAQEGTGQDSETTPEDPNKPAEITVDDDGHLRLVDELEAEKSKQDTPATELTLPTPTNVDDLPELGDDVDEAGPAHVDEPDFLSLPSEPNQGSAQQPPVPPVEPPLPPKAEEASAPTPPPAEPPLSSAPFPPLPGASSPAGLNPNENRVMPKAVAPAPANPPLESLQPPVPDQATEPVEVSAPTTNVLEDARSAVDAAFSGADAKPPLEPVAGAMLSHQAPTLVPPKPPSLGVMPPMPPLPEVPDPKLAPAPTGFVPPKPLAPPPAPQVGSVPPLPPADLDRAPSVVPPVPSGNIAPPMPVTQPPAGPSPAMAPPPMAPPMLPQ